mmetsp:Transcript_4915/g.13994  ORF Transcript_4915/g.13994 Transcript_4915/m.13994 type:complete len:295 (-) Transcript_4915:903-1787(-)
MVSCMPSSWVGGKVEEGAGERLGDNDEDGAEVLTLGAEAVRLAEGEEEGEGGGDSVPPAGARVLFPPSEGRASSVTLTPCSALGRDVAAGSDVTPGLRRDPPDGCGVGICVDGLTVEEGTVLGARLGKIVGDRSVVGGNVGLAEGTVVGSGPGGTDGAAAVAMLEVALPPPGAGDFCCRSRCHFMEGRQSLISSSLLGTLSGEDESITIVVVVLRLLRPRPPPTTGTKYLRPHRCSISKLPSEARPLLPPLNSSTPGIKFRWNSIAFNAQTNPAVAMYTHPTNLGLAAMSVEER